MYLHAYAHTHTRAYMYASVRTLACVRVYNSNARILSLICNTLIYLILCITHLQAGSHRVCSITEDSGKQEISFSFIL